MNIQDIRQKYPQYDKLSDQQLADALYNKFYSGKIDKNEYYAKIGFAQPVIDSSLDDTQAASLIQSLEGGRFGAPTLEDVKSATITQAAIPEIVNPNVEALPELGQGNLLGGLGLDQSKIALIASAALTTPDDKELSDIILSQVPQLGRTFTREGEIVLHNPDNNRAVVINKKGLSRQDLMQALGLTSAFFPAGGLAATGSTLGAKAVLGGAASAATQALIESGQEALGGQFDKQDIAIAGAFGAGGELAAPFIQKIGRSGINKLKAAPKAVIDKFAQISKGSTPETQAAIAEVIKKGDVNELAKLADTDPAFFKHLDILGIKSEPLTSFAARNPAFRSMAGSIEALSPTVKAQKLEFIKELSEKADDIIAKFGGGTDKPAISEAFKTDSSQVIKDLKSQSEGLYKKFFEIVPKSTKGSAPNTVKVIDDIAKELGGPDKLPHMLKKLKKDLSSPTYGMMDLKRREVWQKKGVFDKLEGDLSRKLYSSLTLDTDQLAQQAAGEVGQQAVDTINAAKSIWAKSKVMEDNLTQLLGKDLTGSITARLGQQIKQAPEKGIAKLRGTINLIPKDKRQELIMTSLNDVMKGSGLDGKALNANQYAKWFESLKRSPSTKKLIFDELPSKAQTALNSLYKASIGIARSQKDVIPTGVAKDLLSTNQGLLGKLMNAGAKGAARISGALTQGPTGFLQGEVIESFIRQKSDAAKSAAELMSSPKFHALLKEMGRKQAKPEQLVNAEKAVKRTAAYQKWLKNFTDNGGTISGSFVNYLRQTKEQETQEDK